MNLRKETYRTWQEASAALQRHGIKDRDDYFIKYDKLDPLLHSNPQTFYKDFPGWKLYLGNGFYETWALSLVAAIRLGVTSWKNYHKMRHFDRRLRSRPQDHYADFVRGSKQFRIKQNPKLKPKPELFHEFNHEKEFEEFY